MWNLIKIIGLLLGFTLAAKRDNWPTVTRDDNEAAVKRTSGEHPSLLHLQESPTSYMPVMTDPALKPKRYSFRATIEAVDGGEPAHVSVEGNAEMVKMFAHAFVSNALAAQ